MKLSNIIIICNSKRESLEVKNGCAYIMLTEYNENKINQLIKEAAKKIEFLPEATQDVININSGDSSYEDKYAREIKEYEATPEGQRLIKRMDKVEKKWEKHGNGGMTYKEMMYLNAKCCRDFIDGCGPAYRLGYISGYEKAKKEYKDIQ